MFAHPIRPVGAALSVLCLVGACTGSTAPPRTVSPTPWASLAPGDSSSLRTPAPSAGISWTQVLGGRDVLMMDVVAFPGGAVAVGGARGADRAPSPGLATSGTAGPGACRTHVAAATCVGPVAWTYTSDGRQQGVGPLGSEGGALHRLAWTGSNLIAIGCLGQPETMAGDCARPVAWLSKDGATWTSATVPPTPLGSTGTILRDVVAFGGDVVVAGCLTEAGGDTAEPVCSAAAIWRSTDDGRTWGPPELPDGPASVSQVMALATDGSMLVAAGFAADPWEERIWRSADGAPWERAEVEAAGADSVDRVVPIAGAWLAVGSKGDESATWTSTDGSAWRLRPDMAGAQRIGAIVPVADGLVAIGSLDAIPVVWTSRDGASWHATAADFVLQDPEMAVLGDQVVAVGREGIWLSDPVRPWLDIR